MMQEENIQCLRESLSRSSCSQISILALDPVILKKALFQENGMGRIRAGLTQSLRWVFKENYN